MYSVWYYAENGEEQIKMEEKKNIPEDGEKKGEEQTEQDTLSRRSRLVRELVSEFNQHTYLKSIFVDGNRGKSEIDKPFRYPEHVETTRYHMPEFEMELLTWKESDSPWVILQLHGGGYVGAMKNSYRTMAGLYAEVGKGAKVLTIDYRVAPEHPFPAALMDAYAAYRWLLEQGYDHSRIILGGDSAGGGLAMALCHYLKDCELELPAGIVAMSPWTDLTASGSSYKDNYEIDPVFGCGGDALIHDSAYIGDDDARNPYISPLFGDFEGFPPMLIQVGTCEMLLSDSELVAKKALEAGVKVRLSKYEGMFHVFQMAAKLMPESGKAWAEVGKFIELLGQ